jgi:membrane-bound lytic murein transglycosylase
MKIIYSSGKRELMKKILFALSTVAIMASCSNNNPRTAAETQTLTPTPADTAGLAQFQQWKAQNELAVANQLAQQNQVATAQPTKEIVHERVVYVDRPTTKKSTSTTRRSSTSSTASSSNGNGVYNSTSTNTAKKQGMSKAAKGAIIGGVGGAVAGAVINKRNRGVGAVIGGVLGAGAGYGIGRSKDKKDGRY